MLFAFALETFIVFEVAMVILLVKPLADRVMLFPDWKFNVSVVDVARIKLPLTLIVSNEY